MVEGKLWETRGRPAHHQSFLDVRDPATDVAGQSYGPKSRRKADMAAKLP